MKISTQKLQFRILIVALLCVFSGNTGFSVMAQADQPPTISNVLSQVVEVGQSISLAVSYNDPDGDTVTVSSVSDNPSVASVEQTTPQTLTVSGQVPGSATITVTVDDGRGGTASTTFSVTVSSPNQPPIIDPIAAQTVEVGQSVNVNISYSDPDGDTVTVSSASDNSAVASVTQTVPQALTVTGIVAGSATITVTVDDGRGGTVSTNFAITVTTPSPPPPPAPNNNPPIINVPASQTVDVGQSVVVPLSYNDPDGDAVTVSASPDNAGVATVAQTSATELTVSGVAAGTANITVTVTDDKGGTSSASFAVTVNLGAGSPPAATNNPPVIAPINLQVVTAGQSVVVPVGYSDPDGDVVTVNLVSDNSGVATVSQSATLELTVMGVAAGTANITMTVDDGRGGTVSASFLVTVNPSLPPLNQLPVITQVATIFEVGQSIKLAINYTDPDGDAVTVSAVSDNPVVATVALTTPQRLTITGLAAGSATITITVDDGHGGITNTTYAVIVNPPDQLPVIDPIAPQTVEVGQSIDLAISYSDPDGDPITVSSASDNPTVATVAQTTPQMLALTGVTPGLATITVTVDDGRGGTASTTFAVTINPPPNQLPIIDPIAPQTVVAGQSISLAISYSDPDGDPVTVSSTSDNPGVASVTQTTPQMLTVTGVTPGLATITVTVDDGRGGTASTSFAVTVTFVFAASGDIGANPRSDASLRAIVPTGAAFFLALGDLDYDETPTDAAWCDYVKARVGTTFPFEIVTGNHEEGSASSPGPNGYVGNHAACLPDYFASQPVIPGQPAYPGNYYFDYPQTNPIMRVIMISANLTFNGIQYNFNKSEQTNYNALAARIDEAKQAGRWVIVGTHKDCITTGDKSCEIGADLMNLLILKKVDLVLEGHDHNYQRSKQIALGSSCASVAPNAYNPSCVVDDGSDNLYTSGAGTVFLINGTVGRCCYNVKANDTEAGYFVTTIGLNGVNTNGFVTYTVSPSRIDARVVNSVGTWSDSFSIVKSGP